MGKLKALLGFLLIVMGTTTMTTAKTMEEYIREHPDFSEFYRLLEQNRLAMAALQYRSLTIFVPTNEAFQRYTGNKTYVLYHMLTAPTTLEHLQTMMTSDLDGNPPLFITRRGSQMFINNALIIQSESDKHFLNKDKHKQVLHVIGDVLEPLTIKPSSTSLDHTSIDAMHFMQVVNSLEIGPHSIEKHFTDQIVFLHKDTLFETTGNHTFFIPIQSTEKPGVRKDLLDGKVIDGHVILNQVWFTGPAPMGELLQTAAFSDNIKVTASFNTGTECKPGKVCVTSHTAVGDKDHVEGTVTAEIVRANIPVRNGVVHLISRPLMIVDNTVKQFLEHQKDGPLNKFYDVLMSAGDNFMKTINDLKEVTVFAPSNEAWNDNNLINIMNDPERMTQILNLHIVKEKLTTETIRQNNVNRIFQVPTNAERKFLYFNTIRTPEDNETVTVEGAGVNATIIQPDIAATNGYVHIIDRVLGVPFTTVYEKLQTDPMLNNTYYLGSYSKFNNQLKVQNRSYTYFVPRDKAWQNLESVLPSTHKKLFMKEFSYHAGIILERHLIIADRIYKMADFQRMSNDSVPVVVPAARGYLSFFVKEDKKHEAAIMNPQTSGFSIIWQGRKIAVFRPDVECTNGVIHVIDYPMIEEKDVTVTRSGSVRFLGTTSIGNLVMILLIKYIL